MLGRSRASNQRCSAESAPGQYTTETPGAAPAGRSSRPPDQQRVGPPEQGPQLPVRAHPRRRVRTVEHGGVTHVGRRQQVERVEAFPADVIPPEVEPRTCPLRYPGPGAATGAQCGQVRRAQTDVPAHIVRNEGRRQPHADHSGRGRPILIEVEVTEHRPMPQEDASAGSFRGVEQVSRAAPHDRDQAADVPTELGPAFKRNGDVGERSERDDGERPRRQSLLESDDRRTRRTRVVRQRLGSAAVDRWGGEAVARERRRQRARDAVGDGQRGIAEYRGHARDPDIRCAGEQQDREAVVGIGRAAVAARRVGVDPDPRRQPDGRAAGDHRQRRYRQLPVRHVRIGRARLSSNRATSNTAPRSSRRPVTLCAGTRRSPDSPPSAARTCAAWPAFPPTSTPRRWIAARASSCSERRDPVLRAPDDQHRLPHRLELAHRVRARPPASTVGSRAGPAPCPGNGPARAPGRGSPAAASTGSMNMATARSATALRPRAALEQLADRRGAARAGSGGGSDGPKPAGSISTSRRTRAGCRSAKWAQIWAPIEKPTRSTGQRTASVLQQVAQLALVQLGAVGALQAVRLPSPVEIVGHRAAARGGEGRRRALPDRGAASRSRAPARRPAPQGDRPSRSASRRPEPGEAARGGRAGRLVQSRATPSAMRCPRAFRISSVSRGRISNRSPTMP